MRARAALLVMLASLGLALPIFAQDAPGTPAPTPESTAPTSRAGATEGGEAVAGIAGTSLGGIAIPAGVVGVLEWEESEGMECRRYHGRRSCNGPRRVPAVSGEALVRAEELGLTNHTKVARVAITTAPLDAWVAAAGPAPPGDLLWPVAGGRIWRHWGSVSRIRTTKRGEVRRARGRRHHEGVDIGAAEGTPILAANDGLVVYSWNGMTGYGNAVAIVHGDGSLTLYAHCYATFVIPGQLVHRGQVIAAVGDTGLAHGAHLHFELRIGGVSRDPEPLFVGRPVSSDDDGAADDASDEGRDPTTAAGSPAPPETAGP